MGEDENIELNKCLMCPMNLLSGAIAEIFASVADSGCITKTDLYGLRAAILDRSLSEEERRAIGRVLHYQLKGRVQVVDEMSGVF